MDTYDESLEAELVMAKTSTPKSEGQLVVDVYQTDDDIIVRSIIAGAVGKDLDISVTKDMITIKGTRENPEKIKKSDYYHQELYWGAFSRSIILPVDIDPDKAKASMKNGILTIAMPKIEKNRARKVSVQ